MKKWFKLCPYCANEIKEDATKCQYCKEYLDEDSHESEKKVEYKKNWDKVELIEKWSSRRKWWLALVLIIPITGIVRLLVSIVFRFIWTAAYADAYWTAYDSYYSASSWTSLIDTIRMAINWLLWMISMFWLIWFMPWLAMLLKKDKNYDSYIDLKTSELELEPVYQKEFRIDSLPKSDVSNMMYHWFKSELHTARVVVLNVLSLGLFWTVYCWLHHSDLPHIKEDDFTATKWIWFLFIPFFNLYWICKFWLRLVNRVNFQFKLRNMKQPVSKWLAITFVVLQYIPYVNLVAIPVFWSIVVGQIESAVRQLAKENE